jgi:hypothetical protein
VIALYFNFTSQIANDWWGRRAFLNTWWRANARDHRWTPPVYSFLESTLVHRRDPLMNTYRPDLMTVEAVTRQSFSTNIGGMVMPTGMGDSIVAQALALHDRRVDPATTFLAMMAFANDEETLDRLLDSTWQSAATHGAQRIVAPAQWAPSFSSGLLLAAHALQRALCTRTYARCYGTSATQPALVFGGGACANCLSPAARRAN